MPSVHRSLLFSGFGLVLLGALALTASAIRAQPPAVVAATSTAAAQTAEAAYATAQALGTIRQSATPTVPGPTATLAVAPTPPYAPATQTVAAMTAEAGIAAAETSAAGPTPTPLPPLATLTALQPPAASAVPPSALLPNTGRGGRAAWSAPPLLGGMLALAIGMALRARRRVRRTP